MPVVSREGGGSGAPSSSRLRAPLAVLALAIAAFGVTAASAAAAPLAANMETISNVSYTSAQLAGKVSSPGGQVFSFTPTYSFEYSTDENNWTPGPGGSLGSDPLANSPVGGTLEGLKGGSQYFVRLRASTVFGAETVVSPESAPYPEFTTLPVDPPSVIATDNASDVSYTTATVKGKVSRSANSDPAFDVDCHFQYVTEAQFQATGFTDNPGDVPCEGTNPIKAPGTSDVEAHLINLANNTTYHLRLFVSNASPITDAKEAAATFKTLKVDPPSVISIDNATDVEYTQAQVKGVVERPATSPDPAFDVNCNFEYITDEQFNLNPPGEEFAGATPVACEPEGNPTENPIHADGQSTVKATLGGLVPSTTYHLRLSASNQGGSDAKEAVASFTTQGPIPAPTVSATDDATDVSYKSATVSGEVERPAGDDPALDVNCRFEYITDALYEENVNVNSLPGFTGATPIDCDKTPVKSGDPSPLDVKANLTGLRSGATFHFRLAAENGGGTVSKDAANTFATTPGGDTTTALDPNPAMGYTSAQVSGTVTYGVLTDPALPIRFFFEYAEVGTENWSGPSGSGGLFEVPAGPGPHNLSHEFKDLTPDTDYKFRIGFQINGGGQPPSESVSTGTTKHLEAPTTSCDPVTGVTGTSAHFSCTVDTHAPAGPLDDLGKAAYKTDWHFECTPECPTDLSGTVEGEEGSQAVEVDAKRLETNSSYEVKLIAHNAFYSVETAPQAFETALIPPSVESQPGGSDGEGGYVLAGVVNPNHSEITKCEFKWGPNAPAYAFSAPCSPAAPGNGGKPITVEAHLTGLNPGAHYHADLLIKSDAFGEDDSNDFEFIPTLAVKEPCPANEQLRKENSSLALPECRAYEQITAVNKSGFGVDLTGYFEGDSVSFASKAPNIANSGQGEAVLTNSYVTNRTNAGWETIPNLNGPTGSPFTGPEAISGVENIPIGYSRDLQTSLWFTNPGSNSRDLYLRNPDGRFTLVGKAGAERAEEDFVGATDDLSHVVLNGVTIFGQLWGPGVYEFVGTGNDQPRRVDLDNSGDAASDCAIFTNSHREPSTARGRAVSTDGRVIVFAIREGCGGPNPANGIWARVDANTSYDLSASLCNRADCNAPTDANFSGAAKDGSRVFFTTTQQLVNGDTDQTNDIYACDIPPGTPAPIGKANPCASLRQVSGAATDADLQSVVQTSEDGSTVYFIAKGVLADNKDALGEEAAPGDHNLYVWRQDAAHPAGGTKFLARLASSDINNAQTTADGHYLAFLTADRLVATDTDNARDVYRYDADTGELTRISTDVFGVGGNGDGFDAVMADQHVGSTLLPAISTAHPRYAISDDGQKIVFSTAEPLSPLDGNGGEDVYLWSSGHVYLISSPGSGGGGGAVIDGSGQDIYFATGGRLAAGDTLGDADIYDARIGGGFSFAPPPSCSGETCQGTKPTPPIPKPIGSGLADPEGNVTQPKPCHKGKVRKHGKCVKKHSAGKHDSKKTGHNRGGSK